MRNKTKHALYQTYCGMHNRCYRPNQPAYKNYGARGITVCERWRNSFEAFLEDMGPRPPGHSIDRIDTNGNYEPSNCKWSTVKENCRNMRTKRMVVIDGVEMHVSAAAEIYGLNPRTIYYRVKQGWPDEKVVSKDAHWNNKESQKKAVAALVKKKAAQKLCKRGHPLSGENLYIAPNGSRVCRACKTAADRFLYHGKKGRIDDYL